jgi:hypothetical protein
MWALGTEKGKDGYKYGKDKSREYTVHFLWFFWTFQQQMEGNGVKLLLVFKKFLSQSLLPRFPPSQRSTKSLWLKRKRIMGLQQ